MTPGYATPHELGAALRSRRTETGLTQGDLARRAGVSRQWLVKLEDGHAGAELGKLLAVTRALDLMVELRDRPSETVGDIDLDEILGEYR